MILFPVALGDFIVRKCCRLHDTYARPFEDSLLKIVEDNNSKIINEFYKDNSINTEVDTFSSLTANMPYKMYKNNLIEGGL